MKFAFRVNRAGHDPAFDLGRVIPPSDQDGWGPCQGRTLGEAQALFQPFYLLCHDSYDPQPLIGAGGRFLLVGSFRLDHREALSKELGLSSFEAEQHSDADLVLMAWEKWQDKTPERIWGDFAFCIYDHLEKITWLVVDRDVGRGLYYHQDEQGVCVASGLPVLRNFPHIPKKLDNGFIANFMCDIHSADDATPFADIKCVPWATMVRIDAQGGIKKARYWEFDAQKTIHFKSDDEYVEAARELLDEAVRSYLRINGPFVSCLTGGFDCAAVLGTLQKLNPQGGLHAFTAVPAPNSPPSVGFPFDEGPRAAKTARAWPDVNHRLIEIPYDQHRAVVGAPETVFLTAGAPVRNTGNVDWIGAVYEEAHGLGAAGLFDGVRGNIGLSWDGNNMIANAWAKGRLDKALLESWHLAKKDPYSFGFLRTLWREAIKPNVSRPVRDFCTKTMGFALWPQIGRTFFINHDAARDLDIVNRVLERGERDLKALAKRGVDAKINYMNEVNNLLLERNSFQVYRYGVQALSPLANTKLLEFCFSLPEDQFFHKGQGRWLAKRVLADRMPAESLTPQPRIRQAGNRYAKMTQNKELLEQEVERLASSSAASSILNIEKMREVFASWPKDDADWHRQDGVDILLGIHLPRAINMGQYIRWVDGGNE